MPRLLVFSDDWGRHPSSAQHLVRELLPRWDVDWVHTIGTRRPSLTAADAKRALEKLAEWTRREKRTRDDAPVASNPTIHAPIHWPGFGARVERAVNARIFERALGPLVRGADAIVTTAAIPADLAARTADANWTYYCVDDLAEWPGLDASALRALEIELLEHVKRVVVVSEHLKERMASLGRASEVLTHGIELAHWSPIAARGPRERRARPVATFWGAIDRRMDAAIALALAERCDLLLVGPRADPDARLVADPRIHWRGAVPYAELPRVALESDVLVMPYADLPVTRAMQPLKLKEYLATGLPVVATSLPANRAWADALDLVDDPAEFAARVVERAFEPLPAAQSAARARLADETWAKKARLFEAILTREDRA